MSEQQLQPPSIEDSKGWKTYWTALGMPWRSEREIHRERQQFLGERRKVLLDVEKGVFPFRDINGSIQLDRADVEWLLATHESGGMTGPVDWSNEHHREREGLRLYGADLSGVDLSGLPLACLQGGISPFTDDAADLDSHVLEFVNLSSSPVLSEAFDLAAIHLSQANLSGSHLENAVFSRAHIEQTNFQGAVLNHSSFFEANGARAKFDATYLKNVIAIGAHFEGASFTESHLDHAYFTESHLEATVFDEASGHSSNFDNANMEGTRAIAAQFERAHFERAHLEGAVLTAVYLEEAILTHAYLHGAELVDAHLERASLRGTRLEAMSLSPAAFERVCKWTDQTAENWWWEDRVFLQQLPPADLRGVFFDAGTDLQNAVLGTRKYGYVSVADVRWNGVNLAVVHWLDRDILGDERKARMIFASGLKRTRLERAEGYEIAVRANRQLAEALRSQGLNEQADRFAYRAQVLRRQLAFLHVVWGRVAYDQPDSAVLQFADNLAKTPEENQKFLVIGETNHLVRAMPRIEISAAYTLKRSLHLGFRTKNLGIATGSLLLDLISGYGYRPLRSLLTYMLVIGGFAFVYYLFRDSVRPALNPIDSIIFSVTSFHGRGFMPGESVSLHNSLTITAAIEAIVGLLIEITFIATFTQRFFAR